MNFKRVGNLFVILMGFDCYQHKKKFFFYSPLRREKLECEAQKKNEIFNINIIPQFFMLNLERRTQAQSETKRVERLIMAFRNASFFLYYFILFDIKMGM